MVKEKIIDTDSDIENANRKLAVLLLRKGNYQYSEWVSEWVSECCLIPIFQLYHGENKLVFNEMMMRSTLFKTNTLSWIFIVLAQWNNSQRVDMSFHSDTIHYSDSEPTSLCSFFLMLRA
jgi:hypothetical protein